MDKVPLRNDPKKQTKEKENRTTKSDMVPSKPAKNKTIGSGDYAKWEKFDVVCLKRFKVFLCIVMLCKDDASGLK